MPSKDHAAQMLSGSVLPEGWEVVRKIEKDHDAGGVYSSCYEVRNKERKGFLKAFDYSGANKISLKSGIEQLQNIINAFLLEVDILRKCAEGRCSNIISLLSHGEWDVPGVEKYPKVHYLILEFAEDGDIRDLLKERAIGLEFKIRSLHQLAKGLNQIHKLSIAHQDVKPSNIVSLGNGRTKLTDFGSAISLDYDKSKLPDHLKKHYSGTWDYAPPELLYGEISTNDVVRRIGCDLYLLGSMVVFYFTNVSMTALIRTHLDDGLSWTNIENYGRYNEVNSYLISAFEKALLDFAESVPEVIREDLVLVVRYLCNPDPTLRGHKRNATYGPRYSLERFITMFDRMARIVNSKGLK